MYLRSLLIVATLSLLALFVAINWDAFIARTTLSVGFAAVEAPLGLILIGVTALLTMLFLVYLIYWQSSALIEARRHSRELQSQRELADHAEASRFEQLRSAMEARFSDIEKQSMESKTALLARLDEIERNVRSAVEQSGNTLAAYIGEIEDRLERSAGSKN